MLLLLLLLRPVDRHNTSLWHAGLHVLTTTYLQPTGRQTARLDEHLFLWLDTHGHVEVSLRLICFSFLYPKGAAALTVPSHTDLTLQSSRENI